MSNIRRVAEAAGLSTATVSRALRFPHQVAEETRARVMRAVEELDYRPNLLGRNLRSERAFTLLVLVPGIANPFFASVIAGIEATAARRGYAVLLGDTRDSLERERHYTQLVESRLADGVIQLSPDYARPEDAKRPGYPVVHACGCELTAAPSVRIDNVGAAREVVEHLIAGGHRRIAAISGRADNPHANDRLEGYRQALEAAGIPFDPALVHHGDFSMASGVAGASQLIAQSPRPTALFCMNDEMAIGAIQALYHAGLSVPGDVAVAGFDNIDFSAHCTPSLTTVAQPAEAMGAKACELLIDAIERKGADDQVHILPHRLVVRESTGKVAGRR